MKANSNLTVNKLSIAVANIDGVSLPCEEEILLENRKVTELVA